MANTDRLGWIEEREVHELNNRGRTRSLLAVVFNDRETQQQFMVVVVVVNH